VFFSESTWLERKTKGLISVEFPAELKKSEILRLGFIMVPSVSVSNPPTSSAESGVMINAGFLDC